MALSTFGNANREASLFQKPLYPNIQIAINKSQVLNSPKLVTIEISITNIITTLVDETLGKSFTYINETLAADLESSSTKVDDIAPLPNIHYEVDISTINEQQLSTPTTPGGISTVTTVKTRTANIDILIENVQAPLVAATLTRLNNLIIDVIATALNP